MLLIPAIDLKDGQCVRLRRGDMEDVTVFSDDPVAVAGHEIGATIADRGDDIAGGFLGGGKGDGGVADHRIDQIDNAAGVARRGRTDDHRKVTGPAGPVRRASRCADPG